MYERDAFFQFICIAKIIVHMRVLHVDTSARRSRSHTRRLSALFIEELRRSCADLSVIRRDLALTPPPLVSEEWIAAAFASEERWTPEMQNVLRPSDELIDELLESDLYVLGVPMYNFSVPAVFKSYIDQIVRVGRTFSFHQGQPDSYKGLLGEKTVIVVAARGDSGYGPEGPHWSKNHLEPYLTDVFRFLGIARIQTVAVENDEHGGLSLRQSINAAEATLRDLAAEIGARDLLRPVCCCE
jgi:FMN-dependent NADH-azoreductase